VKIQYDSLGTSQPLYQALNRAFTTKEIREQFTGSAAENVPAMLNHADNETLPMYCLLYTSPSPRDKRQSRMPSSA